MVKTPSNMTALGSPVPDFSLPDTKTGNLVSPADFAANEVLLVMFICSHCPFVIHVSDELARLGVDYADMGVGIVAVSSNDVENHPDDAPLQLKATAEEKGYGFPFCFDETQEVAKAFGAACTPDFFLYDRDRRLVYRGQLDDSRPGNGLPVDGRDLRAAIDAVLDGRSVNTQQRPSIGCNIKWKPGNEPDYFKS